MDETLHPTPERLEDYVDGTAADADGAVVASHLTGCARCRADVEELQTLFGALAGLPRLAPSAGFADTVMARVRVPVPWPARVAALFARLLPTTTGGWALTAAILALPLLATGGAAWWVASRPWLTLQGLLIFGWQRTVDAAVRLGAHAGAAVLESEATLWLLEGAEALVGAGEPGTIGGAVALLAALSVASAWILYENLFARPMRGMNHVSLCV